jgi:hypothetical protein
MGTAPSDSDLVEDGSTDSYYTDYTDCIDSGIMIKAGLRQTQSLQI